MSEYVLVFGIWAGPGCVPRSAELVAGRTDRDTRTAVDTNLRVPERREKADFRRADDAAGLDHHVTGPNVFPAGAHVGAGGDASTDRDPVAVGGDVLLRHDRGRRPLEAARR